MLRPLWQITKKSKINAIEALEHKNNNYKSKFKLGLYDL